MGNNLFDPRQPDGDLHLRQGVAGLQSTMAEAMAIFAPNINVSRRYQPDEFVPVTTDWRDKNRSVAFRIPPSDPHNRRADHRVSGADANPYLVTAAVLAAVLAGVHHGLSAALDPGDMQSRNAGAEVDANLPLSLWQALERIQQASILPGYLDADYLQVYHQVKQAEFEAFMADIHPREYEWYL